MSRNILMVAISAILFGGITAGGDYLLRLGLSVYEISIYTFLLIFLMLVPLCLVQRKLLIDKKHFSFYLAFGFIGASLQLTSLMALFMGVPIAIVAILINSQPIWTTLIGRYFLGEAVDKNQTLAIIIALMGLFILLEPWTAERLGQITGILLSLVASLLLSLWIILGRKGGLKKEHGLAITFGYVTFTLISLIIFYPLICLLSSNEKIIRISFDLSTYQWVSLIIFALIANLIPHLLFFTGIRKVKAMTAGILLLMEPLSATIMAVIFFSQPLTTFMMIGGTIILSSNYLILKKRKE